MKVIRSHGYNKDVEVELLGVSFREVEKETVGDFRYELIVSYEDDLGHVQVEKIQDISRKPNDGRLVLFTSENW